MSYQIEEIKNKIIWGDALGTLKKIPSDSIDMVITSPPYWMLRKYISDNDPNKKYEIGLENSFDEFMNKMMEIMKEIKRVLKPTGTCWINFGDAYGGQISKSKCLLMMPERFAIRCIDELGFILRNKIIWAKQVLFFNKDGSKYTKGSVMPTSCRDRFNQSYEYLFFFTKSKRYYSNLDEVRLPPQTELNFERPRMGQGNQTIYEQKRAPGVVRQRLYPESKYNKFNYRVRDAEKKAGQPQSKASQEEIEAYKQKTGKIKGGGAKLFNLPRARTQRNKVNDPRGTHFGGPGSWRDFKDENESFTYPLGKNIPVVFQINPEPHNFQKELGEEFTEHFAVFPQALLETPIKFGCPPNGIVLDPFAGSFTTALVAEKLGRNWICIDLSEDYCKLGQARIYKWRKENKGGLFNEPLSPPPIIKGF